MVEGHQDCLSKQGWVMAHHFVPNSIRKISRRIILWKDSGSLVKYRHVKAKDGNHCWVCATFEPSACNDKLPPRSTQPHDARRSLEKHFHALAYLRWTEGRRTCVLWFRKNWSCTLRDHSGCSKWKGVEDSVFNGMGWIQAHGTECVLDWPTCSAEWFLTENMWLIMKGRSRRQWLLSSWNISNQQEWTQIPIQNSKIILVFIPTVFGPWGLWKTFHCGCVCLIKVHIS